jgi:hypothetical protein
MIGRYMKHDPKGLISKHATQVSLTWPCAHEKWEEELFNEDAHDWKEVKKRRDNPGVTIFSSLPVQEQIKIVKAGASSSAGLVDKKLGKEEDLKTKKERKDILAELENIMKEQDEERRI